MGEGGVALGGCWEVVGEDETAERISGQISTVRIKFTLYTCRKVSDVAANGERITHSFIVGCETNTSLVDKTSNLNVSWRFDELANGIQAMPWLAPIRYAEGSDEGLTRR